MSTEIFNTTPDCIIVSSRIIHAHIHQVYKACSEPIHLMKWWGPHGFTNTFNEFDFRVGGKWSLVMHGPDQANYINESEFTHIEFPTLIAWKRFTNPLFNMVLEFDSISDEKTQFTFKMMFNSAKECNAIKAFVIDKNEENFDRLEVELLSMT